MISPATRPMNANIEPRFHAKSAPSPSPIRMGTHTIVPQLVVGGANSVRSRRETLPPK